MRNTKVAILALTFLLTVSCAAQSNTSGSNALIQSNKGTSECRAEAYNKCQSLGPDERRECNIAAQNACAQEQQGRGRSR